MNVVNLTEDAFVWKKVGNWPMKQRHVVALRSGESSHWSLHQ